MTNADGVGSTSMSAARVVYDKKLLSLRSITAVIESKELRRVVCFHPLKPLYPRRQLEVAAHEHAGGSRYTGTKIPEAGAFMAASTSAAHVVYDEQLLSFRSMIAVVYGEERRRAICLLPPMSQHQPRPKRAVSHEHAAESICAMTKISKGGASGPTSAPAARVVYGGRLLSCRSMLAAG